MDKLLLKQIKKGDVYKNYKELCSALQESVKGGDSKISQLKEWSRFFNWKRQGYKFIITEIYNEPKPKIDGRGKNPNSHHNQKMHKKHSGYKVSIENSKSIGVYKISLGNKIYIGSTTIGFRQRFLQHLYRDNTQPTREMLKNGAKFEVLEIMDGATEEEIRKRETDYVLHYRKNPQKYVLVNVNTPSLDREVQSIFFRTKDKQLSTLLQYLEFKLIKEQNGAFCFNNTKHLRQSLKRIKDIKNINLKRRV